MANITKIQISGTDYDIKDDAADITLNGYVASEHTVTGFDSAGTFAELTNCSYVAIPVEGGEEFTIVNNGSYATHLSFLQSLPSSAGDTMDYSTSTDKCYVNGSSFKAYSAKIPVTTLGATITGTIPDDVNYLFVQYTYSNLDFYPSSIVLDGKDISESFVDSTEASLEALEEDVEELDTNMGVVIGGSESDIDLTAYTASNGLISGSSWTVVTNSNYQHIAIPVKRGREYTITANDSYSTYYAVLASYTQPTANGDTVDLSSEYSGAIAISAGNSVTVDIPDDGTYLYIMTKSSNDTTPSSIVLEESSGKIGELESLDKVQKVNRLFPNTMLPVISFEFDDADDADADVVELFDSLGVKANFAFIANSTKLTNYGKLYLQYQHNGHSILSHSIDSTALTTDNYTTDEALAVLQESKNTLESYGFVINGFVAPESTLAEDFIDAVKCTYAYAFTYADSYNNGRDSNPCNLVRYSMEAHTTDECTAYIDSCISDDKIITFYGHSANFGTTNSTSNEEWNLDKLQTIVEYAIAKRDAGDLFVGSSDECVKYYFGLNVGNLADLTTTDQSSIVNAINEVDANCDTNASAITTLQSSAVTSSTSGLVIEVVSEMPSSPDENTIYIVQ